MSNITVAAHQANFMPNLGYFYKMLKSDIFVVISNLQFEKQEGWQQRNKFPGKNGDFWLTIPVLGSQNQLLKDVKIDNTKNWVKKHLKTFEYNYSKTKEKVFLEKLKRIYTSKIDRLAEINMNIIKLIKDFLGVPTKLVIDEDISGKKHELLANICDKYKANVYLSGKGAVNYMSPDYLEELEKRNIKNIFIDPSPISNYHYSILHYMLSEGKEKVNEMLGNVKEVNVPKMILLNK